MKKILLTALIVGFSFNVHISNAHAGILEFFFPSLAEKEEDPSITLRAPFADPIENNTKVEALSINKIPLELAHRQPREMADVTSTIISNSLVFQEKDYEKTLERILTTFDEQGKEEYKSFLNTSKILRVLKTEKFFVRSFVSGTPILMNSGPIDGRYRWLFDVPIMISYMNNGISEYKAGEEPTNQRMTIRIQLGRTADAPSDTGVMVERWSAKIQNIE
ncbi:MAG: hypothetical protein CBB87_05830 [Micavibrio sp. TMED27]|nr:hypothetical protein [Micavibrio sp.]OUT91536.1 MAG: hypothetical protein CBB87_05830 [Micavibrio sp. TMED27]